MRYLKLLLCCACALVFATGTNAQGGLLRKMKNAADRAADKVIDKKTDEAIYGPNGNPNNGNSSHSSSTGKAGNKGGAGLITTPPNVAENLTAAETAYKGANYGDARYAVQQA